MDTLLNIQTEWSIDDLFDGLEALDAQIEAERLQMKRAQENNK